MMPVSSPTEIYIFVGPPGSGKGSLASICFERIGWEMLSTGNLCRKHIAEQTEIGQEIDFAIKSGKLVSDELISQMVAQWFVGKSGQEKAVILDGYPRTLRQAETFDNLLKNSSQKLKLYIVQLMVSDETVVERLSFRFMCSNKECQAVYSIHAGSLCAPKIEGRCDRCNCLLVRRVDDEAAAIRKRLQVYYQHAKDLLSFYDKMGYSIVKIDVEKPLELVFEDFAKHIGVASI
ncbi:MAG: nucleoside monophosphate kinase [Candidatus Dependentiae bacterium]|nr:nucleoside monophosphate kinase [Candidatus Dependentiae bacterium]